MKLPVVSVANRSKIITKSGFKGYDVCINPYVGCGFGCSYCYVAFFVRDEQLPWGEFVRVREHLKETLPKELRKGQIDITEGREPELGAQGEPVLDANGKPKPKPHHKYIAIPDARLVFGTMTDPYQPQETKHHITRAALDILINNRQQFQKVGLFTRSPLVLHDLPRLLKLPKARVHFTITPFPHDVMRTIEPISPNTDRRWKVVQELKAAGLRVHVNVSPVMPGMSEDFIEEWVEKLIELKIDEYFVDPMQPYKDSFDAFRTACQGIEGVDWAKTEAIMTDKERYLDWKFDYLTRWNKAREKIQYRAPDQLPIWSDHENKVWVNMETGQQMDPRHYND